MNLKFFFLCCSFFGIFCVARAQSPAFTIDVTKGCAPLQVTVRDDSGADPTLVFYRFGDNSTVQTSPTFTFKNPGVYSITQYINTGSTGGDSLRLTNVVEVFENKAVAFDVIRCTDKLVTVQIQDDYYDSYKIDFGDNNSEIVAANGTASHQYSTSGDYTITVKGIFAQGAENCKATSKIISTLGELKAPTITKFEYKENRKALISYQTQVELPHQLEKEANGVFTTIATLNAYTTSFELDNVNPGDVFRISVTDPCNNVTQSSKTVYAIDIMLSGEATFIDVAWNDLPSSVRTDFESYTLKRNGKTILSLTDADSTRYKDESVICNVEYCFMMEVKLDDRTILSPKRCILATSNAVPSPVYDVFASFTPTGQVQFWWRFPSDIPIKSAKVVRIDDSTATQTVFAITPPDTNFIDTKANIALAPFCYQISYVNACGLESAPSPAICPIVVKTKQENDALTVSWNTFGGLATSNYVLELADSLGKDPFQTFSHSGGGSRTIPFSDLEVQSVWVRVRASLGDTTTYSNSVRFVFQSSIDYPNAFTPNRDNLNDTYGVRAKFIKDFQLFIFNRWGEAVFETNDPTLRWNGMYRNELVPSGEYTLKIVATDYIGKKYNITEMIKIIR